MSEASSLDPSEIASLSAVLDTLVPPDAGRAMPGAGELGLAPNVAAEVATGPAIVALLRAGLERIEAAAGAAASFADLDLAAREQLLRDDLATNPGFVGMLIATTYILYYEHPTVLEGLALEARPPHPLGYELAGGDLSLLDPVRERSKLYRDC